MQEKQRRERAAVLVVDDDPALLGLLECVIGSADILVRATDSATDAVRWAQIVRFEAAVCDVQLQGGNGLDVARALRARDADIPVVLMSGAWTDDLRREAGAIPGVHMINKPVDIIVLRNMIRHLLNAVPLSGLWDGVWASMHRLRKGTVFC